MNSGGKNVTSRLRPWTQCTHTGSCRLKVAVHSIETVTLACKISSAKVENVGLTPKRGIFKIWGNQRPSNSKFCKARGYHTNDPLQMCDRGEHCANGNAKFQRFALWEAEPST